MSNHYLYNRNILTLNYIEIELEIINSKVGIGTEYNDADKLEKMIKKCIINILSGIQGTNFPVSYNEIQEIGNQYLKLTYGKDYNDRLRLFPKSFIGPSSTTLQIKNITPVNEDAQFPNIRDNYTVTDKADGMRKLLYINDNSCISILLLTSLLISVKIYFNLLFEFSIVSYSSFIIALKVL